MHIRLGGRVSLPLLAIRAVCVYNVTFAKLYVKKDVALVIQLSEEGLAAEAKHEVCGSVRRVDGLQAAFECCKGLALVGEFSNKFDGLFVLIDIEQETSRVANRLGGSDIL